MMGRKVLAEVDEYPHEIEKRLQPGDYCKIVRFPELGWLICCPNGDMGTIRPPTFTITEHDDGTITVGPASIQVSDRSGKKGWHGYLHQGEWKDA